MSWDFIIIGFMAVATLVFALYREETRTSQLKEHGIKTKGIVLKNKFHLSRASVFRPIVQFKTEQGQIIEAEDMNGIAIAIPRFSKGEEIILLYEEANPRNFTILSSAN
ncbi:DUF3592 domain-containing protein [Hymenobacter sp. GOD-10R]|uniref:DUF3592 domain-containing protein n=1 Tax=Hymenobacter sp. GOD-10R TaxID=3093922 RepID=UPI002D76A4C6|nr:DUF3592 domain-containing protein [Hymenobacter sp. GOD-10R]WRQ31061.1 DUF3592 domain-containing protein [Hymenobacter sp. GOD-10R]